MNIVGRSYFQYCAKCESHFIEDIGETCRCPVYDPEEKPRVEHKAQLLSKWQVGEATL